MINTRLWRPAYILARFAEMLIALISRMVNAVFFGGSTHQTTSARAYIDGMTDPEWARRRVWIDRLFWFHPDHCKKSWELEVYNAHKTLSRAAN